MFKLENEIKRWKKNLYSIQAFEDGYIAELESHLRDQIDDYIATGRSEEAAFRKAVKDLGNTESIGDDYFKINSSSRFRIPHWQTLHWLPSLLMNLLTVTIRSMKKQRLFATINIMGLAVGIAASLLICNYVVFEKSYDKYHKDSNLIYRMVNERHYPSKLDRSAGCTPRLGPEMQRTIPAVVDFTRVQKHSSLVNYKNKLFRENNLLWVDNSFLSIFSFQLIEGDKKTVLEQPHTAVISKKTAEKYFGEANPIGNKINVMGVDYEITGIAKNSPENTILQWDILLSFITLPTINSNYCWACNNTNTFIKTTPDNSLKEMLSHIPGIINKLHPDNDIHREYIFQPLEDIHLKSNLRFELSSNGNSSTVDTMLIISIAILIIAWLNYINLASARAVNRAKEVGIRKTVGAGRFQLIRQFLTESLIINLLSLIPGLLIFIIAAPFFNSFAGLPASFSILSNYVTWGILSLLILTGSLLSGFYPAFIMSSFKPGLILRKFKGEKSKGGKFRKLLIIFQFSLSLFLIAGTITIWKQVSFMKSRDLGINIKQTLAVKFPTQFAKNFKNYYGVRDTFINRLKRNPIVKNATFTAIVPGEENSWVTGGVMREGGNLRKDARQIYSAWVARDFFEVMDVKLIQGRNFLDSDKVPFHNISRKDQGIILNETAVRVLGFKSPADALNKVITSNEGKYGRVVGVIKDYHGRSLDHKVIPITYFYAGWGNYFIVKLSSPDSNILRETISRVESYYKEIFPENTFEYFFLDNFFDTQYRADVRFYKVFGIFSFLAIFIGSLGLLGLTAFSLLQRRKEIGIRKVFGASVAEIFYSLSGNFAGLILISAFIAMPSSYYVMTSWLSCFVFRIELGIWFYTIPIATVLILSYLTISGQVYKACSTDPAKTLREE